jgi:hypothetical protein
VTFTTYLCKIIFFIIKIAKLKTEENKNSQETLSREVCKSSMKLDKIQCAILA